jgi:hypothetical protein
MVPVLLKPLLGPGCTGRRRRRALVGINGHALVPTVSATARAPPMRHFDRAGVIMPQRIDTHELI